MREDIAESSRSGAASRWAHVQARSTSVFCGLPHNLYLPSDTVPPRGQYRYICAQQIASLRSPWLGMRRRRVISYGLATGHIELMCCQKKKRLTLSELPQSH